jgi:hypothetical protein
MGSRQFLKDSHSAALVKGLKNQEPNGAMVRQCGGFAAADLDMQAAFHVVGNV